jgi:hypothetical protein
MPIATECSCDSVRPAIYCGCERLLHPDSRFPTASISFGSLHPASSIFDYEVSMLAPVELYATMGVDGTCCFFLRATCELLLPESQHIVGMSAGGCDK